jgi:translation initiation factor 3 subunit H
MYLGTICTNDIVQYQYNYQSSEELSENSVVIMYDPIVSTKGVLVLKAFRLSKTFLEMKRSKSNQFIRPSEILEELPLKIRNVGHVSAFLRCIQDTPEVFQHYMTLKKISQLIVIPTFFFNMP